MTRFLSEAWFELLVDESASCSDSADGSAELLIEVIGATDGTIRALLSVVDGRIVSTSAGPGTAADLALALPYDLGVAIVAGETTVAVEFMRGALKASGDMGALHRILPLTAEPGFEQLLGRVAERTEF